MRERERERERERASPTSRWNIKNMLCVNGTEPMNQDKSLGGHCFNCYSHYLFFLSLLW